MSSSLLICLSSSQGHRPWPVSRPWLPVHYTWKGLMAVCRKRVCRESSQLKNWYVWLLKASRRLASCAQTTADPCGDSPASSCCWVPLKTPRPCLSDWPDGLQCHPATPHRARHGVREAWVGSMAASPNFHILVILSAVSPPYALKQQEAVIYRIPKIGLSLHITHIHTYLLSDTL